MASLSGRLEGLIPVTSRFHRQLHGSGSGALLTSNTLPCFKATSEGAKEDPEMRYWEEGEEGPRVGCGIGGPRVSRDREPKTAMLGAVQAWFKSICARDPVCDLGHAVSPTIPSLLRPRACHISALCPRWGGASLSRSTLNGRLALSGVSPSFKQHRAQGSVQGLPVWQSEAGRTEYKHSAPNPIS